jgi:CheY-like chemotaxis protein
MLPAMTGVELAETVRRTHPQLPVLFMTGYSGSPGDDRMPPPGSRILRKPYRPDVLCLEVAEVLRQRSVRARSGTRPHGPS